VGWRGEEYEIGCGRAVAAFNGDGSGSGNGWKGGDGAKPVLLRERGGRHGTSTRD
jgi:hypothetical protein